MVFSKKCIPIITAFSCCCLDTTTSYLLLSVIAALIKTQKQQWLKWPHEKRGVQHPVCLLSPSSGKVSVVQTQLRIDRSLIFIRPVESAVKRHHCLTEEMERSGARQERKEAERELWEKTGEGTQWMSREGRGRRSDFLFIFFFFFFVKAGIRITREEIRRMKRGSQELGEKWRCRDLETSLLFLLNLK